MASSSSSISIPIDAFISFHSQERALFKRLVFDMEIDHILAMAVIAYWMWLESVGHPSLIQHIVTMSSEAIRGIIDEGATCLTAILFNASDPSGSSLKRDMLTMSKVPGSPIDLRYLYSFWASARKGITSILENICPLIFKDLVDSISSRRALCDAQGMAGRLAISTTEEGNSTVRAANNPQMKNEGSILGPYNGERSRSFVNQSRSTRNGGMVTPLMEGTPIMPYGEGSSRGPRLPLQLPFYCEGNIAAREYQEMFTPERWHLFNMLGMQQEIQSNYMQMLLNQSFQVPNHHFSRDLNMGGLSISSSNMAHRSCVSNQAFTQSNHVQTFTALSPYFLMHPSSSVEQDIPQDERTLFITFSSGYPLGERDLFEFFNRHYGGVEGIHIQEVTDMNPLFARAVFYLQETCLVVLNGREKAKFIIRGRHAWARRYIPKKKLRALLRAK